MANNSNIQQSVSDLLMDQIQPGLSQDTNISSHSDLSFDVRGHNPDLDAIISQENEHGKFN